MCAFRNPPPRNAPSPCPGSPSSPGCGLSVHPERRRRSAGLMPRGWPVASVSYPAGSVAACPPSPAGGGLVPGLSEAVRQNAADPPASAFFSRRRRPRPGWLFPGLRCLASDAGQRLWRSITGSSSIRRRKLLPHPGQQFRPGNPRRVVRAGLLIRIRVTAAPSL